MDVKPGPGQEAMVEEWRGVVSVVIFDGWVPQERHAIAPPSGDVKNPADWVGQSRGASDAPREVGRFEMEGISNLDQATDKLRKDAEKLGLVVELYPGVPGLIRFHTAENAPRFAGK